jgi:hypothetical protein
MTDLFFPVWYNYPESEHYVGGVLDWEMLKEMFFLRKFHGSLWTRYLFNIFTVTNIAMHFVISLAVTLKLSRLAIFIIIYLWIINLAVVQVSIKVGIEYLTSFLLLPHIIHAKQVPKELEEIKKDDNPYDV